MKRVSNTPRRDWRDRLDALNFDWRSETETPYWVEDAYWQLSQRDVAALETATAELYGMIDKAVRHVIDHQRYAEFGIPDSAIPAVVASLPQRGIYGRFDFAYRGIEPPKMLEFNAETPYALYEASVVQREWLRECFPASQQMNSIHDKLVEAWRRSKPAGQQGLHLAYLDDADEDNETIGYLAQTAEEAGWDIKTIPLPSVALTDLNEFVDADNFIIGNLFKLYPWDWIVTDDFGAELLNQAGDNKIKVFEPAWKMIANHKAMLALLWELNPGHPNLLEAHMDRTRISGQVCAKAVLGRQGSNIAIADIGPDGVFIEEQTGGAYDDLGYVFQRYTPLAHPADDIHAVICSWVIDEKPAGIGIRECSKRITDHTSRFIPHKVD